MTFYNFDIVLYSTIILILMVGAIISIIRFIMPNKYQFIKCNYFNIKVCIFIFAIVILKVFLEYHNLNSHNEFEDYRFGREIFLLSKRNEMLKKIITPYFLIIPLGNMISDLLIYIIKKIKK